MKKLIIGAILLLILASTNNSFGQSKEQVLNKEIGIRINDQFDFDFIYKKQKDENVYKRVRLVYLDFSLLSVENLSFNTSIGFNVGREKRRPLSENFSFIKGWEISGYLNSTFVGTPIIGMFSPGFGLVFGLQYDINPNFILTIETIPSTSINFIVSQYGADISGNLIRINTSDISLGLLYRFKYNNWNQ